MSVSDIAIWFLIGFSLAGSGFGFTLAIMRVVKEMNQVPDIDAHAPWITPRLLASAIRNNNTAERFIRGEITQQQAWDIIDAAESYRDIPARLDQWQKERAT